MQSKKIILILAVAMAMVFVFAYTANASNYSNYNYNYNYNYPACTYHAYRLCDGNNIYWYDSCGNRQDLYQVCSGTNMICQYGQCVYQQPVNPYVSHSTVACYQNNLYWFDSLGAASGLYQACSDSNSCTVDSCSGSKCAYTLKCDGSTCATGTADYNTYCAPKQSQANFSVSFSTKKDEASDWSNSVEVGQNSQLYFEVTVANNGMDPINNIKISANIPYEVATLGNIQVNGTSVSGDIINGITIDSVAAGSEKALTFEGRTETFSIQSEKQATATATVSNSSKTATIDLSFNPSQSGSAAVSGSASGFWEFLKRWYLWILIGAFLLFLFIVVFRRLSSNA